MIESDFNHSMNLLCRKNKTKSCHKVTASYVQTYIPISVIYRSISITLVINPPLCI